MTTCLFSNDADATTAVPELYWKKLLHQFPEKGVVRLREVIFNHLYSFD